MSRQFKRDKNQKAHERLLSWTSWIVHYVESSALDAKIVNYGKDRIGGIAGPIVPDVMKPKSILETENAVNCQSQVVQRHITCFYGLIPKLDNRFIRVTKHQREDFLKRIGKALYP